MRCRQFGVLPDGRQGRAQLVRRVADEPALRDLRLLQTIQHPVHRPGERAQLVVPRRIHSSVEAGRVDGIHLPAQPLDGSERAGRHRPHDQTDEAEHERHGDGQQHGRRRHRLVDTCQRSRHGERAAIGLLARGEVGIAVDLDAQRAILPHDGKRPCVVVVHLLRAGACAVVVALAAAAVVGALQPHEDVVVDGIHPSLAAVQLRGDRVEVLLHGRGDAVGQRDAQHLHGGERPGDQGDGDDQERAEGEAGADGAQWGGHAVASLPVRR